MLGLASLVSTSAVCHRALSPVAVCLPRRGRLGLVLALVEQGGRALSLSSWCRNSAAVRGRTGKLSRFSSVSQARQRCAGFPPLLEVSAVVFAACLSQVSVSSQKLHFCLCV